MKSAIKFLYKTQGVNFLKLNVRYVRYIANSASGIVLTASITKSILKVNLCKNA